MRHTILALTAFAFMITSVGCGGGPVADIESMASEICKCEDEACAEKVTEKYEGKHDDFDPETLSDEDKARVEAAAMKMVGCALAQSMPE